MKKNELIFEIANLSNVAKIILESNEKVQVIALKGALGAGKTTLAIQLLKHLGISTEMQSPTYTYVQIYQNAIGKNFYHFDLYRLKDQQSFLFAGFDEFLYQSNSLVIIEWPEIIESLLDYNVCTIELEYIDDEKRKISWNYR